MIEVGVYVYVWQGCSLLWGSGMSIWVVLGSLLCGQEKQKLLSWYLWHRVLCKRTSCKYFLLSSFWFFCCFYSTLQSGFRAKYSVTFISDSENAHGFSPNYILQLEGNCRASGNCTIYFSVKWEEVDLGLGSLPEVNVGLAMHWTDTLTLIFQWLTQTPMWFSKMEAEWKCLKWNT